jgi:hypothetical protein
MKLHINYADGGFYEAQKENSRSALTVGGADKSLQCRRADLDDQFVLRNAHILNQKRGAGYWLWKPYIINKHLRTLDKDDYLIYTDSGMLFVNSIDSLIEIEKVHLDRDGMIMTETTQWIPEGPPWKAPPEYMWTKRDTFVLTDTDRTEITHTTQANAAFILMQPRDKAFAFLEEWLRWGSDVRAITDIGNCMGKPNYEGFSDHRHDQSLFSVLGKKHEFRMIGDITHWGEPRRDPKYKTLIQHNRNRN